MSTLTSDYRDPVLAAGAGRASGNGMRDLLRDTGLLVTTLVSGGHVQDAARLRDRCVQLIEQFSNGLERRGYSEDVRIEAQLAQCALLDEAALRHLSLESRFGWELKPLQVERFNMHDAGERVFERLDARMREPTPELDLLECYSAILGMGFVGRYARVGEAQRTAFISSLNTQIERLRSRSDRPFVADRFGRRTADRLYRLLPWVAAALACLAAAVAWTVCSASLNAHVAHIVASKVAQP
ncbi:type IV secretion protein DotU [Burkholderia ubonensis]|uniref:DotU family type IV/VI secretion system protein n=1 Tax=Burkholderia ubonensis TaxID=101571 RepID=UPI000770D9BB|nr:DotU family type IV/VI secretion system protein [Burkholderia ubonensis]KVD81495.1 type IV secretion protein DotU [Burkholderia ubonensis]